MCLKDSLMNNSELHENGMAEDNAEFDERIETHESNFTRTNIDQMSPRTRDKYKLMKMIKLSFKKYGQCPKTTSDFYRIGRLLGKGAFGRVNLAIHKLSESLLAVKSINK